MTRLRSERGLSMDALAAVCGFAEMTISRIESDKPHQLRRSTALQLLRGLMLTGRVTSADAHKILDSVGLSRDIYGRLGAETGSNRMVAFQNVDLPSNVLALARALVDTAGTERAEAMMAALVSTARTAFGPAPAPMAPIAPPPTAAPTQPTASETPPAKGVSVGLPPPPPGSVAYDAPSGARVYEPVQPPQAAKRKRRKSRPHRRTG